MLEKIKEIYNSESKNVKVITKKDEIITGELGVIQSPSDNGHKCYSIMIDSHDGYLTEILINDIKEIEELK